MGKGCVRAAAAHGFLAALLALAPAARATQAGCPFLPEEERETKLLDRLSASLKSFKEQCQPKGESALNRKLAEMEAAVSQLNKQIGAEPSIPRLGTWLHMPVTCGNFPGFLSAQRDDAYRRYANRLTPADNASYKRCFEAPNPTEATFLECIDSVRDEQLQYAKDYCQSTFRDAERDQREKMLATTFDLLNENVKALFQSMQQECAGGNSAQLAEAALKTATTVATAYANLEPVSSAAGMGIALGGSVLNQAITHLFRRPDAAELLRKEQMIPELACLLLDTMERDLNCNQLLRPVPPSQAAPAISPGEALFAKGPENARSASVEAVLRVMDSVESRAARELGSQKDGETTNASVELASNPVLDRLILQLNKPVNDPTGTHHSIRMLDYLKIAARDLQFAGSQTGVGGPSEEQLRDFLRGREFLYWNMKNNLQSRGPEFNRATGALGVVLDEIVDSYSQYEAALNTGDSQAIGAKRKAFLEKVQARKALDMQGAQTTSELLRQAIDRHWALTLSPQSGLRALRQWENARAVDEAQKAKAVRGASPLMRDAFRILKDGYAAPVRAKAKQTSRELTEVDRDLKKKSAPLSERQREDLYLTAIQPMVDSCTLLAGVFIFGENTTSTDAKGISEYEKVCAPLLCEDGSGVPAFDARNLPAVAFREHQCKLIYDHAGIRSRLQDRFVTEGTLCATPNKKTFRERAGDTLRGILPNIKPLPNPFSH